MFSNLELLLNGDINADNSIGVGDVRACIAESIKRWQGECGFIEPLIRCFRTGIGITDQVWPLARAARVRLVDTSQNQERGPGLESRDAFERPATKKHVRSFGPISTKLSSLAKRQLVDIGEIENVVNIPTRSGVVLPAIEWILNLYFSKRRLAVQRFLPTVVHIELQPIRIAFEEADLQRIVSAVVSIGAAVKVAILGQQTPRSDRSGTRGQSIVKRRVANLLSAARTHVTNVQRQIVHQLALNEQVPLHGVRGTILRILRPAADRRGILKAWARIGDREIQCAAVRTEHLLNGKR